ncbi:MAG: hypothetical protein ABSF41_04900 [Pseudolabrys sp.]|jgi:hypothetical protein
MPDDAKPPALPIQDDQARPGFWGRCKRILDFIDNRFHFFVSLPVVTLIGSLLASHFQYLSANQDEVDTAAKAQLTAAEITFADVAVKFAKAITLQQYIYFDYRDAIQNETDGEEHALETKDARAVFPQYDELRINLRENVDLLARNVERDLDWHSDRERDAANATVGVDPVSRIALGYYNFQC